MSDDTDIRALDPDTVARIAAGEVVERPASAVKELVENSIDADATRIDVAIEAGGTESIVVRDDGVGMTEADLRAAVREHTTSKLDDADQLDDGIATLGFRGEALHTIGAVSRLTIRSRPRDGEAAGTELVYEGGEVRSVSPVGCPEGTTVEVRALFETTPARKKYLGTATTEFTHVNRVVSRYALANPDVAVSLTHDDSEVFATPGRGDLREAVLAVYGREVAEAMCEVAPDALPEGPLDAVGGLVSEPETNRAGREYVSTFINGRYVRSETVRSAVLDAYGGQLASDRYPFAVLRLQVDPGRVDVNVHPRKMEVRFDDDAGLARQVRAAVEAALLEAGLIRSSAPRGKSAPGETEVRPASERAAADRDDPTAAGDSATGEASSSTGSGSDGTEGGSQSDEPTEGSTGGTATGAASPADERTDADPSGAPREPERTDPAGGDRSGRTASGETSRAGPSTREFPADAVNAPAGTAAADASGAGSDAGDPGPDTGDAGDAGPEGEGVGSGPERTPSTSGWPEPETDPSRHRVADQRDLTGERASVSPQFETLPALRVLGQLHDTYLVAESDDGLVLIDQHAADERIHYERLRDALDGEVATQRLVEPIELELTPGEAAAFDAYAGALAGLGFATDRDGETVLVEGVPALFDVTVDPARLRDVFAALVETGSEAAGADRRNELFDAFLGDLACHPAVTGNVSLTEGSVRELLSALDGCENPYACPHGRPVVIEFDRAELEERFERDYPGHGGRRE